MGPLDFLKQKLQQGLSGVENWGQGAENDISNAVKNVFSAGSQPQQSQPPSSFVQQPQTARSPMPSAVQVQNSTPAQPQMSKPVQLQNEQPDAAPVSFTPPKQPAIQPVKINNTPSQPIQPRVAPVKIATPQKSGFSPTPLNNQGVRVATTPNGDNPYGDNPLKELITRPVAEIAATLTNKTITPNTDLEKRAFSPTPIKPIQSDVAGVYRANTKENGPILAAGLAGGDAVMHILNDLPFAALGAKGASMILKAASEGMDVTDAVRAAEAASKATEGLDATSPHLPQEGIELQPGQEQSLISRPTGQSGLRESRVPGIAGGESLQPSQIPSTEIGQPASIASESVESQPNFITKAGSVNDGFPAQNLQAEIAAHEAFARTGDLGSAVKAYQDVAGGDYMTALSQTTSSLQSAGRIPFSEDDVTKIMSPVNMSDKVPSKTADALKKLEDTYKYQIKNPTDTEDLLRKASGLSDEFKIRAKEVQKAMESELAPEERQAVRDILEGEPVKTTPEARAVADALKQFNEKGLNVLQVAKPDVREVANYATRLYRGPRLAEAKGSPLRVKFNQLSDLFDTRSRFGEGRQIGKFVSADGEARYGTQRSLGLRAKQGELVDANGKVFRPVASSTKELTESGGLKFEKDYGKIAREYHGDVGRVMARYQALQELLSNPAKYGISDMPEAGLTEIKGVPELAGKFAPVKEAQDIMDHFRAPDSMHPIERAYQGLNNTVTQFIVYNPLFHGRNLNQLAGMAAGKVSVFGPAELKASYLRLATGGAEYRDQLLTRFLRAGGGLEHYGSETRTALTNALDALHLPHLNKANSTAMASIDKGIRLSLFDLLTNHGMDDGAAVREVDKFLGDRKMLGQFQRNILMFWNYTRTQLRAAGEVRNPGVALAFAEQAAAHFGVQKAFQEWTGNKHTSTGNPGVFGLINTADQLRQGRVGAVASTKINPLATTAINQLTGTDLYSGTPIKGAKQRIENAVDTLFSPSQLTTKVANGKASIPQEILQAATGASLPHTKGSPAIPNASNPLASVINLPGSKPAADSGTIHDPTGLDQATQYYNAKDKMTNSLQGDQVALDAANQYLDKDRTPDGKTILNNQYEQAQNYGKLASNDKALSGVQKFEQSQPNHNPMWDLPTDKLKVYLSYKSMIPGDPNQVVLEQKYPWLTDQFSKETDWGSKLQLSGNAVQGQGYVPYPNLSQNQKDMITQVTQLSANSNRTPDQEKQLQDLEANPDLQTAFGLLNKYTNDRRALWPGVQPIPYPSQSLNPEQEQMLQYEGSLPKGTKSAFIRANQDAWNQIQQVLAENTIYNVERYGGIIQQGGTEPNFLKDVYNAGKYDIAPVQQSDGSTSYQLNPGLAYQLARSGSGGSQKKPLVALPKRPKKNVARVIRMKKPRTNHKVRIAKSPRIHIKKSQVMKPVHIGHGGPLKIRTK